MKIVIEHGKTKREISGPFNICGDPKDLRDVADSILTTLDGNPNRGYGWIFIAQKQKSISDTPPKDWED